MAENAGRDSKLTVASSNPNLARDHLANERTFLAWIRTGIAGVVFGFAIGRFAVAIRQWMAVQGQPAGAAASTTGISVWFGTVAILGGVVICFVGLVRYRKTREQIDAGNFQPAGFIIDLVAIVTAIFGLALAGYLVYIQVKI